MTNITFDLRVGGASAPEILIGTVALEPTSLRTETGYTVLPLPTTINLAHGEGHRLGKCRAAARLCHSGRSAAPGAPGW